MVFLSLSIYQLTIPQTPILNIYATHVKILDSWEVVQNQPNGYDLVDSVMGHGSLIQYFHLLLLFYMHRCNIVLMCHCLLYRMASLVTRSLNKQDHFYNESIRIKQHRLCYLYFIYTLPNNYGLGQVAHCDQIHSVNLWQHVS